MVTLFQEADGSVLHTLTLLPESDSDITNYTCIAHNSLGQGRATVALSGLPSSPVISSGELSASLTSYELVWHTGSIEDIIKYNVLYRKLPVFFNIFLVVSLSLKIN